MYNTIENNKAKYFPLMEVMIGQDTIKIDDEGAILGLYHRQKQYLFVHLF